MVEGNTQHRYKEALALVEEASPGTKQQMYFGFLKRAAPLFAGEPETADVVGCTECGAPTVASADLEVRCSFCKTKSLALGRRKEGPAESRRPARRRESRAGRG